MNWSDKICLSISLDIGNKLFLHICLCICICIKCPKCFFKSTRANFSLSLRIWYIEGMATQCKQTSLKHPNPSNPWMRYCKLSHKFSKGRINTGQYRHRKSQTFLKKSKPSLSCHPSCCLFQSDYGAGSLSSSDLTVCLNLYLFIMEVI